MAKKKTDAPADMPADEPVDETLPGTPAVAEAATDVDETSADAPGEGTVAAEAEGETDVAEDEAESPSGPSPVPAGFEEDRQDQLVLELSLDIALGNGLRKAGTRLGWLRTAVGRTLAEAEALVQHPGSECRYAIDELKPERTVTITTGAAVTIGDTSCPADTHVANLWLDKDIVLGEAKQALLNRGVVLK